MKAIAGAALAGLVLAACAGEAPPPDPTAALDGRWVGYFESSLGPFGCPGRGPMSVEIERGEIAGEALGSGYVMSIAGGLGPNGAVRDGVFRRDDRAAAVMTGTFLEKDAAGRWQSVACEGVWSLRKVAP